MAYTLQGISKNLDSCQAMIAQKAYRLHRALPAPNQRWLDPEDIQQELAMAAIQVDPSLPRKGRGARFKDGRGSKFSTYLHQKLTWAASNFNTAMRWPKRYVAGVVELDAPETENQPAVELAAGPDMSLAAAEGVRAFFALFRAVGDSAKETLILGLLFHQVRAQALVDASELERAAARLKIGYGDLQTVSRDENIRKKVLRNVAMDRTMGLGTADRIRCLECTDCRGRFTLADIRDGRFFVTTMTCHVCYRELRDSQDSCFGRVKSGNVEGYSATDVECRLHCLDRQVCRGFIKIEKEQCMSDTTKTGKSKKATKKAVASEADLAGVDFDGVEGVKVKAGAEKGDTKKKKGKKAVAKKSAAKAKAKAAAKPKAADDNAVDDLGGKAPEGFGGRWPFKSGSGMRHTFVRMYKGVKQDEMKEEVIGDSYNWRIQYAAMAAGGTKGGATHTWKLDEAGGRYQIYDVKPVKAAK